MTSTAAILGWGWFFAFVKPFVVYQGWDADSLHAAVAAAAASPPRR